MNDEALRRKVRLLKANKSIDNYYQIAELLEMNNRSFYNWLQGAFNFGYERKEQLRKLLEELYIPQEDL